MTSRKKFQPISGDYLRPTHHSSASVLEIWADKQKAHERAEELMQGNKMSVKVSPSKVLLTEDILCRYVEVYVVVARGGVGRMPRVNEAQASKGGLRWQPKK